MCLLVGCSDIEYTGESSNYVINNIGFTANADGELVKRVYFYSDADCINPVVISENLPMDLNTYIYSYNDFYLYSYDLGSNRLNGADVYRMKGSDCEFYYNSGSVYVINLERMETPDFITYKSGAFYY